VEIPCDVEPDGKGGLAVITVEQRVVAEQEADFPNFGLDPGLGIGFVDEEQIRISEDEQLAP
jgi:hypothetical protein